MTSVVKNLNLTYLEVPVDAVNKPAMGLIEEWDNFLDGSRSCVKRSIEHKNYDMEEYLHHDTDKETYTMKILPKSKQSAVPLLIFKLSCNLIWLDSKAYNKLRQKNNPIYDKRLLRHFYYGDDDEDGHYWRIQSIIFDDEEIEKIYDAYDKITKSCHAVCEGET